MSVNEMRAGYGHGDYLSDIGNVSQEVRHGMWAFMPFSVDDVISEENQLTEALDRGGADAVASAVKEKFGFNELSYLSSGGYGYAYDVGDGYVVKVTLDHTEAKNNYNLLPHAESLERIAKPYGVFRTSKDFGHEYGVFVIILEKLELVNQVDFNNKIAELNTILRDAGLDDVFELINNFMQNGSDDALNDRDVEKELQDKPELMELLVDFFQIGGELRSYGINTIDFLNVNNLGYKDGKLAFFDIGADADFLTHAPSGIDVIDIEEEFAGGGTKFTTDDDVSSDGFPTYNNIDTSPSIRNDLDANSALYESPIPYGRTFWAWVSPENTFHIVPKLNHKDFIMRKYNDEEWGWDYDKVFDTAIQDGWVRVIYEYFPDRFRGGLSLNGYDKQRVKDVFIKMFYDLVKYGNNSIYIDYENPKGTDVFSTYSQETKDKLIDFISEDLEYRHVDDATADEFVIFENIQRMDKEYVKSGIFTEQDRENVLEITNGDNYTFDVAKMYDFYMSITNPNLQRRDNNEFEKYNKPALTELYNELRNYDKNVIPIKDKDNLKYGIELAAGLKARKYIVDFLKLIPSVYLRNLKNDIRQPRTTEEIEFGSLKNKYIPTIKSRLKDIKRLSQDKENKILSKVFSSKNDTFEKVAEQMEKLDVLFLHHDDGVEELRTKANYEAGHGEAEIIYDDGEVIVVSVKSSDAMKNLGCGSQWCFATEYGTEHWKDYSHNTNINIIYNFNKNPESRKRMVVILANGEIYDMYNEYMDDGDEYLGMLGVTQYLNAGTEPADDYDEDDELNERKKAWIPGSQSVEVKRECQLGGLGDGTSKACNQGDINNLVLKTIQEYFGDNENIGNFATDEGVGDRYLARREPGRFPDDEFSDFDVKYNKKKMVDSGEEIVFDKEIEVFPHVGEKERVTLVKNPKNLSNFGANVRGIIDKEGNLFVETMPTVIHIEIISILSTLGFINVQKNWDNEVPKEFLTVQRGGNKNQFFVGHSYNTLRKNSEIFKETFIAILQFFRKARIKNPRYTFIPEMEKFYGKRDLRDMLMDLNKDNNVISEQISTLNELPFKEKIENLGGKIFSVGGAVRDEFLGKESKDLDVLITGVPMDELEQILSNYGRVDAVGKSFGVLKFRPEGSDEEIDVAIPRTETATGDGGHKGFDVTSDHELPIEKDLLRRDFTINAIAKDISGNVVDPYNGREDLQNKIIRVVNPDAFAEDPLRMLRAVQFASRFGFTIEPETMNLIQENASRIKEIPAERILIEFDKIVQKGNKQIGAELLVETGLYENIFGVQPTEFPSFFENIKTMGEFIFTICKNALNNCAEFYKNNLKGEIDTYKEIKAYEFMEQNAPYRNPVSARSVIHNMYLISPHSIKSNILPDEIKVAASDLLSGKYPKTVNELAVSGGDLMQLGLQGKQIGDIKKKLLIKVYGDKIENNKENLLTLANEIMSEVNEVSVSENINNNINNNTVTKRREDKPIMYSGVILDETSRQRILRTLKMMNIEIPEGWEVIAHHVTIAFGQRIPTHFTNMNNYLGMNIRFSAVSVAMDDKVIAVGVEGVESLNEKPHITVAVNREAGGKPKHSNDLTNWIPFKRPLRLVGGVEEVEFKG